MVRRSRRHITPATPYQRLLADTRTSEEVRRRVTATFATLDPVRLLQTIRAAQRELVAGPLAHLGRINAEGGRSLAAIALSP
jgi:hypothetical protein